MVVRRLTKTIIETRKGWFLMKVAAAALWLKRKRRNQSFEVDLIGESEKSRMTSDFLTW